MTQKTDPWKEYRRLRRLLFGAALAGLVVFVAGFRLAKSRHSATPLYVGLGVGVLLVIMASAPISDFTCPRCGEPFIHNGRRRDLFTRKCLHCQFPRGGKPL
jgi:predicted RNA-binding Zn-ribbon protein involved in translation (DUF1610 family)